MSLRAQKSAQWKTGFTTKCKYFLDGPKNTLILLDLPKIPLTMVAHECHDKINSREKSNYKPAAKTSMRK